MSKENCNGFVLTPDLEARLRDLLPKGEYQRCIGDLQQVADVRSLIFPEAVEERLRELAQRNGDHPTTILASHEVLDAEAFLVLAAGLGLFNAEAVVRYPKSDGPARVTLHRLVWRDHVVRHATLEDLDRLCELERLCWAHTRASRQRIRERLTKYPQGQFVLERAGTVLGVVYSQRIASVGELDTSTAKVVHRLHTPSGSIIQLLALNVDPKAQDSGFGDQLLEFMLQRCSLVPGVDTVVGVTLCKKYDGAKQPEFARYLEQRGAGQDPVLAFHAAHGASIVKALANYRPDDVANRGNGVLVRYDIHNRVRRRASAAVRGGFDERRMRRLLRERVTALSGGDSNAFDADRPVMEMGLDSADLLKLQQAVEAECGQCLQPGFFFQFNTVNKVIARLASLQTTESAATKAAAKSRPVSPPDAAGVAVIGMACRLPGGIDTPDDLWEVLANGRSVIGTYPASRGAWPSGADKPGIDRGGFLHDAEAFDAAFFRMSPREARITDPQQRILLELAWTCLEDAGVLPASLKGSRTGVFIGASNCDYERLLQESKVEIPAHYAVGCSLAVLANRLSYYFDLCGPSLVVDTACSASLVALHTALRSLETGECGAALVGGVNLICHPHLSLAYHKAGMLADDGSCKVFDAAANGYVRSEGAVMLLLKPLARAIADGDRIHAVIRGSATNHGGLAAGLTVPNPQMQAELLTTAWERASVTAGELTYLEAHGTGTSLGDPLEIQGMQAACNSSGAEAGNTCAVGSVKSNLGHLEAAAGITGLLKVILCLQRGQLPASANFSTLNPKLRLEQSPLHVLRQHQAWDARPRIAGVSSFGSGGANAHVVVQEHVGERLTTPARDGEFLFVLSAADPERLTSYAAKVADWLRETPALDIADAIHTWQVGRTAMQERLAIRVHDRLDLLRKLEEWLSGGNSADTWSGRRTPGDSSATSLWHSTYGQQLIDRALAENALEQLALLWTSGIDVDWQRRYVGWSQIPRRIGLPAYPFARERYWIEGAADAAAPPEKVTAEKSPPLFFRECWAEQPPNETAVPARHASTLVFADAEIAEKLARDGAPEALRTATFVHESECRADDVAALRALLARTADADAPIHLIHAWARNRGIDGVHSLFALFDAIRTCGRSIDRVTLVGRYDPACVQTCWDYSWIGLQRSMKLHLPRTAISLLFTASDAYPLERLLVTDAVTWFREDRRYTLALEPVALDPDSVTDQSILRQHGSYLITGGCGSLGFTFARYLAQQCGARLLLLGRRPLDRDIESQLDALRSAGAQEARYESVDLGDAAALTAWAQQLEFNPSGIIHAAGVMGSGAFYERTAPQIEAVLQPKTRGCQRLDELFADVDFRCYFSSSSALLGDFGACDYAIANRFQMAYAHHREATGQGGRAVVINWPLWQQTAAGGMNAGDAGQTALYLKSSGQRELDWRTGIRIWRDVMRSGQTQVLAMTGDAARIWQSLAQFYASKPSASNLSGPPPSDAPRAERVRAEVRALVSTLLQIPASRLDDSTNLADFGFDSILLGQFAERLTTHFGVPVTPVLFFSATTIAKLGDHLASHYSPLEPARGGSNAVEDPATREQRIAIVGMAGRFPQARNIDEFWRLLDEARSAITEIPASRWDWRSYFTPGAADNRISSNKGGFIDGIEQFDPLFFDISPVEAEEMDPAERLLLMEAYSAIEDAGVSPASLRGRNVGVFVGMEENDYRVVTGRQGVTTAGNAMVSSRLSYFLDLRGPVIATNTACSSGLVALHQAAASLSRQECESALVAGLSLNVSPSGYLMMSQAGMLSPDGECRSFAARANGIVVGEAVVALLLKPLSAAIAAGDRIYGCIRASGINFDGKTNGVTAPSGERQAELLESVYTQHGIAVEDLSHVVCHGTGTKLGDPVEIDALNTVFRKLAKNRAVHGSRHCALTSCKSNVGHTMAASGLTSVVGLLKGMQHHRIPASLHCEEESNYIAWDDSAFHINKESRDWVRAGGKPHLGAVSAFGRSGTNAHVVIEEHTPVREVFATPGTQYIVPLSARTAERLGHKARDLLSFVRAHDVDLGSLAYTLQVGREAMEERAGFIVSSIGQLAQSLQAFIAAEQAPNILVGRVSHGARPAESRQIATWIAEKQWSGLLGFWSSGGELDWNALYGASKPSRISAPTYPFATEPYWLEGESRPLRDTLHPLLHRNTSDLDAQSYSTTFTGEEFFLKDHQVQHQRVLPGVAYLEMVRAALVEATPAEQRTDVVELRNVGWLQPIVVDASTTITTTLSASADEAEFEVHGQGELNDTVHCRGMAAFREHPAPARLDIATLKSQMTAGRSDAGVYDVFSRIGLHYGPAHRGIACIERGQDQLLARLELPASVEHTASDFVLHPSLMDAALQAAVTLIIDASGPALLPVAIDSVVVLADCGREMFAWARHAARGPQRDKLAKLDVDLCDAQGNVCVQIRGFASMPLAAAQSDLTLLAAPVWQASPAAVMNAPPVDEYHVLLCETPGAAERLQALLPGSQVRAAASQDDIGARFGAAALDCFAILQEVAQAKRGSSLVQVVVPGQGNNETSLFAGLGGMLQTAALENPRIAGQIVMTDAVPDLLARQLAESAARPSDTVIRYTRGQRQVLRWQEQEAAPDATRIAFKEDGVYLITGGLGELGVLFAQEILRRASGARIVLAGRSALTPEAREKLENLSGGTDQVRYQRVDVCVADEVNALIAGIVERDGRLNGVIHAAGVIRDNFILKKTSAELTEVLGPKVRGTLNLDRATQAMDLDFLVLFSSLSAALGNVGQADYAAANGFMDWFATVREGQGRGRTLSINWPLWRSGGMQIDEQSFAQLSERLGVRPLQDQAGIEAFYRGLQLQQARVLVMQGDAHRIRQSLEADDRAAAPAQPIAARPQRGDLAERTEQFLRQQFSTVLKLPAARIDAEAPLERYGIDSILAMNLTRQLEKSFGSLSKTLFFEYQTLRELSVYLQDSHAPRLAQLFGAAEPGVAAGAASAPPSTRRPRGAHQARGRRVTTGALTPSFDAAEPIAIVGLSGRYPQARDLDSYWRNLREGRDCIVEVPPERWNWRDYYSADRTQGGRHYSKWGGFIEGVDEFDPRFFNIAPREAASIDPQERLFLQHCWMAIEDAGYTRESLQIARASGLFGQVGVYAGVMYGEYNLSGSLASIANRVSWVLNLHGPSVTLDTMCSSSLTAIHFACQDLKSRRTDLALAGGVNISAHPNKYSMLSAGQFISSDGHCQSFGEGGDGYIPAEGVGVVVLKRLSDAERDGDPIYGLIRGSALNHGGKTNGYTVPNPQAQAGVIGEVLADARVDARHISYIEAHGTGTRLGDPIEIAALSKAFQRHTQDTGFCLIGSAKSNIGHGESAAGIAGLTKVLLQMKHRQIVPSLHSRKLNPHIDFARTPFIVNQRLTEWQAPVIEGQVRARIAGISSFGAGGSNAHLIVEESPAPASNAFTAGPAATLIVLSARTDAQLQQKARDLLQFVRDTSPQLASLAFTLQTGREAMAERLGLVAGSIDQLQAKLESWLKGEPNIDSLYRGQASLGGEGVSQLMADADFEATVERWVERQKFEKLLGVWVQGFNVDWRALWSGATPRRISLPAYPFAREKYWKTGASVGETPVTERPRSQPSPKPIALPLSKPTGVALMNPNTAALHLQQRKASAAGAAPAPRIQLEPVAARVPAAPENDSSVRLADRGDGVFVLSVEAGEGHPLTRNLIEGLVQALEHARQQPELKVLMIAGSERSFLSGDRAACEAAIELGLYRALVSFPLPVIASVEGDALGAGFLAAALCDFMICSREASCAYTLAQAALYPSAAEYLLFRERFGEARAREFLYQSTHGGIVPTMPRSQVRAQAEKLAATLAGMSRESLQLLKVHLARELVGKVEALRVSPAIRKEIQPGLLPLTAAKYLRLESLPENILLITALSTADTADAALRELTEVFAKLGGAPHYRCIVVAVEDAAFAGGAPEDAVMELRSRLLEVSVPVVGALKSGAGIPWLISQYFDACVCSETGVYSAEALLREPRLSLEAAAIFPCRYGAPLAAEILLTGREYTGAELLARAAGTIVTGEHAVLPRALAIARDWSQWPAAALACWKETVVGHIRERLDRIEVAAAEDTRDARDIGEVVPVALNSKVIRATAHPRGILVVSMEEREARNRFSDAFIAGMNEVFEHIEATPDYKVVVLTGYESYFAAGGTKEALLAIHAGTLKYSDAAVFELPLRCRIPVIAAMQGHGMGAGWALGMFCDLALCSEESVYSTRFMSFGFTPGAGSTLIFPHTLGHDIARAALLTAGESSGRELRERGIAIPVLPRREVLPAAMQMAQRIATHERGRLVALKHQLSQHVRAHIDDTYECELAMQEKTFVGQAHTLERIHAGYLQEVSAPVAAPAASGGAKSSDSLATFIASVRKLLADELYLDTAEINEHAQFVDLGLDSITGVTWIRKINEKYGLSIEATSVYSHPTLAEFSRYARDEATKKGVLIAEPPRAAPVAVAKVAPIAARKSPIDTRPAPEPARATSRDAEPIAVVGIAGQFPGATNLDRFWQNIAGGVDCVSPVPKQRWDIDTYYREGSPVAGKSNSKWMGALEEYDLFDPLFFAISPTEAQNMDPQQRLFLQACWNAIENAGYNARAFSGTNCGVFVGVAAGDYYRDSGSTRLNAQELMGNAPSILAARISYFLNLQGPCVCIDTACSSSLVAIANACDSLCAGVSDMALAGGVHVMAGPAMHIMTSQAGMLSPDGKCFTFDERANGFVPAEAVGVVVLKRLADAEHDQDVIHGVIRGWGVNQDGKTNGITAPNPLSQTRLQQAVYDKFRIDPAEIQLIEAHGTGTKLGDPIEIEALKASFAKYTRKPRYCAVGSVKSNIGHALTAAGVSGFIKLMLALQHRKLPPTANYQRLNGHITLADSPFYINDELRDWELNGASRRQAAISSFGFSGTNCHMVVAEHAPAAARKPVPAISQHGMVAIPLSARTEEQLRQRAVDLLELVRSRPDLDLQEVAYTLQAGREAMDQRLGFMAGSIGQLAERLREYLEAPVAGGIHRGQVKQSRESMRVISEDDDVRDSIIEKYLARGEIDKLLQLWVKGLEVNWNALYGAHKPRRIAIPTYPFAKERYWLEPGDAAEGEKPATESALHPLLHRNTSDFSYQRYTTTLTGRESFLADHVVRGRKILPGVAYLEMARAALADAAGRETVGALTLRNVVWARALIVENPPKALCITLHPEGDEVAYEISSDAGASGTPAIHGSGRAVFGALDPDTLDLAQIKARTARTQMSAAQFYSALENMGLQYGASHQRVAGLHIGEEEVLARLSTDTKPSPYVMPLGLLDSAFQACLGLQELTGDPALPFAMERLDLTGDASGCTWAWVRRAPAANASDRVRKLDIDLCDEAGKVCVRVRGLSARAFAHEECGAGDGATGTLTLEPIWLDEPVAVSRIEPEKPALRFVFLCGFETLASALQRKVSGTVVTLEAAGSLAEQFEEQAVQLFERLQRLIQQRPQDSVFIQVLVPDGHDVHAALGALLQSARLENSRITGQVIAMRPSASLDEVYARLQENSQCPDAEQVRYQQDRRQVRQLVEVAPSPITFGAWRDNGVYLVTGGCGGLGMIFARALAARTRAATVILTGRSELDAAGKNRIAQLRASGLRAEYRRVDVTDAAAVQDLVDGIRGEFGSLTGILHCAGIIDDSYLAKKTVAQFRAVLAPKIAGTCNLDAATRSLGLEFFVLFSSIAGVLGGAGQSDYAVANAFMDAYAGYRNELAASGQRSGRTLSINWPLWQSDGMGVDSATETFFRDHFGMLAMPPERGIDAFERALSSGKPRVLVMDGMLERMRQRLLETPARDEVETAATIAPTHHEIDRDTLLSRIRDTLRNKVARYLKIKVEALDFDTELTEFGFDSISFTELTNQLNQGYALTLTPTVFFEFPTLSSLAAHLAEAHRAVFEAEFASPGAPAPEVPAPRQPAPRQDKPPQRRPLLARVEPRTDATQEAPREHDPIAIIGVSGKFPQADTLEKFWENLRDGRDCIEEIPESRWDWRALYGDPRTEEDKTDAKWGGFIAGLDEFDPLFFGISPREAQLMDPQQRLLMTYVWKVIESAGYSAESLSGSSTGLFIGTHSSGYQELASKAGNSIEAYSSTGMSTSVGPNRMSYFLNLHGPSEPIETACSSSLVAIHRAVEAIQSRSCETAIAGGVNALVSPWMHISFSKAGMLCKDGRCKTFSDRANGYVRGEGVGMLFLKKLSAAERDGDQIFAVIRGSAENHGGRASSLTAPNPKAQASLLEAAYRHAGIDPRTVGYIEAHGTGTELGDPIEINALKSAFQTLYAQTAQGAAAEVAGSHCGLGSLKSNIGHLELAAGVAGVIKVLLQLKHQTRVKTLHCGTINPYIDLRDSPFYIVRENDAWPRLKDASGQDLPRRAGVSSFGFGGVNAHIVLEEYVPKIDVTAPVSGPHLIVLSARTQASLRQAAENLHQYLEGEGHDTDLGRIAYTLQVGRDSMEQRLALLAHSRQELQEKLQGFLHDEERVDLYRGEVRRNQDALAAFAGDEDLRNAIDVWIRKGKYDKLLSLWVKGLDCDWNKLYPDVKPTRVDLPTYAFARERVWFETPRRERRRHDASRRTAVNALHPLLHINTSNLGEQSYRTHLSGEEFFLKDHQVSLAGAAARPVLPAVAHLEMARAAIERALPESLDLARLELRDVTWLRPVVVTAPKELSIVLIDDAGAVGFEILSQEAGAEIVHCEGQAIVRQDMVRDAPASGKVDLAQLRQRIRGVRLAPEDVYAALDRIGLKYGPAHRPLTQVVLGEDELLADLQLPATLEDGRGQFLLHPSLMDGALQAAVGFLPDLAGMTRTLVPFSLDSLRVSTIGSNEMVAWLRRSESSLASGTVLAVDIDLLDRDGNICVSMRGFSARALENTRPDAAADAPGFADAFYRQLIERVARREIAIDEAAELG